MGDEAWIASTVSSAAVLVVVASALVACLTCRKRKRKTRLEFLALQNKNNATEISYPVTEDDCVKETSCSNSGRYRNIYQECQGAEGAPAENTYEVIKDKAPSFYQVQFQFNAPRGVSNQLYDVAENLQKGPTGNEQNVNDVYEDVGSPEATESTSNDASNVYENVDNAKTKLIDNPKKEALDLYDSPRPTPVKSNNATRDANRLQIYENPCAQEENIYMNT